MMKRASRAAAVAACVVLLTGCGGAANPAPPSTRVNTNIGGEIDLYQRYGRPIIARVPFHGHHVTCIVIGDSHAYGAWGGPSCDWDGYWRGTDR